MTGGFTMLGSAEAAVCEGDACVVPGAVTDAADAATASVAPSAPAAEPAEPTARR